MTNLKSLSKPFQLSFFLALFAVTNIYGSNMLPTHGPTTGGFTITITAEVGEPFGSGGTITIGSIPVPGADIMPWGNGFIQFKCPAGVGANLQVVVNSSNGNTYIPNQLFSFDAPTITAISPDAGPQAGGTTVTLTGTNFGNTTLNVLVGTLPATIAIMPNHTSLSFTTPTGYGADIPVKVIVGGQPSNTIAFNYATTGKIGIGTTTATNLLSVAGNTDIMGSVGIGTFSPSAKLHVVGKMLLNDGTQGAGKVLTTDANGVAAWSAITETDPKITTAISNKIPKWDGTKLVDGLITDNGTNIGIGIVPTKKLDIVGAGGLRVSTTNSGSGTNDWIAGNFGTSAGNRVVMGNINGTAIIGSHTNDLSAWADLAINTDPTSKVGIGTQAPANKLTVSGNMDITGNVGIGTNAPIKKMDINGTGGLRVSTTYTGTGSAVDWIAGNFGGIGTLALGDRVVMGNLGARATIGAHNDGLSSWASLAINPGGGNVGIGITAPENTLHVNGSAGFGIINITVSTTLNTGHHTVIIERTNNAVTITLPGPNLASNRVYIIVNRDDNDHTITGFRPIITTPAETLSTVIPAGSSITLQSNTNYWYQIK